MDHMELYRRNEDFRRYVDKYCKKEGCSPEDAVGHLLVQEVGKGYEEGESDPTGRRQVWMR